MLLLPLWLVCVWWLAVASGERTWAVCYSGRLHPGLEERLGQLGLQYVAEIVPGSECFQYKQLSKWRKRGRSGGLHREISGLPGIVSVSLQKSQRRTKRDLFEPPVNDPFWDQMWYLNRAEDLHMNVQDAWKLGISGRGVAVTILDDGIEKDHPDLIDNYDPLASTDINDNDSDPNPRYDFSDSNRHGTRCAGQVSASANNSLCATGIAFDAQIGGIRMLDGQVSDAVEARSLSFNPDHIDIYSSSWGPNDDGKTVDGPGKLARRAFFNGIQRGREGRGSVFVWASGNGGRYKDDCNCDGYATSIYTITVSSTSQSGHIPWYSEPCSSTLTSTYSSGTTSEPQIVTTDLHHQCTTKHTGTSASAPMASAIIALVLEAKPELTWRDVQHIIVRTSRPLNLNAPDWMTNAMGRKVSHSYGYGLMDAAAMEVCTVSSPLYNKIIPAMNYITIELDVHCDKVMKLEHVVAPIHVNAGRKRGDLRIYLHSPMGTRSTLLHERPQDYSSSGFIDWPFMTVHSWGENPNGTWTLEIHNNAFSKWASDAKFYTWSLELYGTPWDPNEPGYEQDQTFNQRDFFSSPVNREDPHIHVVREIARPEHQSQATRYPSPNKQKPRLPASTAAPPRYPAGPESPSFGCLSPTSTCSMDFDDCREYEYRNVAELFCDCNRFCDRLIHVARRKKFRLLCTQHEIKVVAGFCKFVPFLS